MLVAHVEQDGVWYVDGGMYAVAETLTRLIEENGGEVRCNAPVSQILLKGAASKGFSWKTVKGWPPTRW